LLALALPSVPTVEPFSAGFPRPRLPDFKALHFTHIFPEALALALLASLDSLLCAASVDARVGGPRTRNDQELVAQGLANMASACVGGMPVAAAVVRSMAAIEARATTRLAPLFQSICLVLVLMLFGQSVTHVPLVALAAILLVVGYRLLDIQLFRRLWRVDRWEAAVLVGTSLAILATDFVSGVGLGCGMALTRFAYSMARSLAIHSSEGRSSHAVVRLEGPLFFANQTLLDQLSLHGDGARGLMVDLSGLTAIDSSGAVALRSTLTRLASEARPIWLTRFPPDAAWLRAELALVESAHLRLTDDESEVPATSSVLDDSSVTFVQSPPRRAVTGATSLPPSSSPTAAVAPSGGE
jgi:SulP family sulfate permease